MTLIEKIRDRFSKRAADYTALVRAEADGKPFDLDEAVDIMIAERKTHEDLARDAESLRQRRADVLTMAAAVDAKAELSGLNEQSEQLKRAFDAAVAQLHRQLGGDLAEIDPEVQRCQSVLADARQSRQRLIETAPAELKTREAELSRMRQSQAAAIERIQDILTRRRYALKVATDAGSGTAAIAAEVSAAEKSIAAERDRLQSLSAELEQIRQQKMEA